MINERKETQLRAVETFRSLHASGCFVMPNPWDAGTAVYLARLGFPALATTSSGAAFSWGLPDDGSAIPVDRMLAHIRDVVAATSLPVNADFQSGYADDPAGVGANVTRCIETGVAGLSIEDATGQEETPLYEASAAVARVGAARSAIDASGIPVVLTARCEAWLVGHPDARSVAMQRLVMYAEAGADCLFAPGVRGADDIAAIVKAVSPKPVNVLVSAPSPLLTVEILAGLGVRRISLGSALARVAWGALMRAAESIAATGTFTSLGDAAPFAELDRMFRGR